MGYLSDSGRESGITMVVAFPTTTWDNAMRRGMNCGDGRVELSVVKGIIVADCYKGEGKM